MSRKKGGGRGQMYAALMYLSFTATHVLRRGISTPCGRATGFAGMIPPCGLEPMDLCAAPPRHSKQETQESKEQQRSYASCSRSSDLLLQGDSVASRRDGRGGTERRRHLHGFRRDAELSAWGPGYSTPQRKQDSPAQSVILTKPPGAALPS